MELGLNRRNVARLVLVAWAVALTWLRSGAGTSAKHWTERLVGQVTTGAIVSCTVICCVQVERFPQASAA